MLDIKLIRENTQKIKEKLAARQTDYNEYIDKALSLDSERRALILETEELKMNQNLKNKEIPVLKKNGMDVASLFEDLKKIAIKIKEADVKQAELEAELEDILLNVPNIPNDSVPVGADSNDNVEIRREFQPKKFDFKALPHWDLGQSLKILDPETAAKVTGARFHFYIGAGAKLERAVINFFLDTHGEKGYTEVFPPYMVNRDSMRGTGQLPKLEDGSFKITDTDYFLIPTAEVPVTNMHRNEILTADSLPKKYCAYSACFRSEAGSAGRDTRGLIRQHQFNKVELVKFVTPETSDAELEALTEDACNLLRLLELPFRVVLLCTGDMGFASAKTYDIEVWMPSYNNYFEISSCSNFEDYQARRAAIRYKTDAKDKSKYLHTLNGSGLAVGRTVAAILENYQNADGSVTVPSVLRKYMNGIDVIK